MSKRSTITAISALLLVGSFTLTGCDSIDFTPVDTGAAPGKQVEQINVAEDTNVKTDLDSIARAEELNFAYTEQYFTDPVAIQSEGTVKFALSGSATQIAITTDNANFIVAAISQTGKVFTRTNKAATVNEFADLAAYNASTSPIEGLEKPVLG